MTTQLTNKITHAAKWSALGEAFAKLVTPVSAVILARVLTPQAFGVIATITMIVSFAEIFMDAGFQRYVIQKEYETERDKYNCANVAFWSNLAIGLLLWGIIFFFREPLAVLVGNSGLGTVLAVAAISIPINAITSIQMAIFKHSLDFKSLFYRRLASVITPLVITIPLAFYLRSYWALVWGTIASNIINAIVLTVFSPWRPSRYYNFCILKGMIGYSSWSLLDAILVWSSSYIEIFFIGIILNDYYLGLYKTAMTTVGQLLSVISAIILPVLMPALSRSQYDFHMLRSILLKSQKFMGLLILPLGGAIFIFRNQLTSLLLGNQWGAISTFLGIWAIAEVIMLLYSRFCSNIYPAIGRPNISVINQLLFLFVLLPAVYISAKINFETLYWARTLVRICPLIINWIFAYKLVKFNSLKSIYETKDYIVVTIIISILISHLMSFWSSNFSIFLWGPLYVILYFGILALIPRQRSVIYKVFGIIRSFFKIH